MVSKHTLGRVIQEFVRIFPGSRQAVQNTGLQHIPGTVPLENPFPHAASNFFHHVALRLEFGSGHDGTGRGHDPGLFIAELQDHVHRVHAAADPRSGEIVQSRIAKRRGNVSYRQNIRSLEKDVDVAVGVGQRQVAIVDLFGTRFQRAGGAEGFRGPGGFGASLFVAIFVRNPVVGRHPLPRVLVRDDLRARSGEHFVVARLIGVIVRVEE